MTTYFYKDKEIVTVTVRDDPNQPVTVNYIRGDRPDLMDCLCVDTSYPAEQDGYRYGKFISGAYADVQWVSLPMNRFPKDFRTQLLLLGVS